MSNLKSIKTENAEDLQDVPLESYWFLPLYRYENAPWWYNGMLSETKELAISQFRNMSGLVDMKILRIKLPINATLPTS